MKYLIRYFILISIVQCFFISANASCSGQTGEHLKTCLTDERAMLKMANDQADLNKKIILKVKSGSKTKSTNKYQLFFFYQDECQFIKSEGNFEVTSVKKRIFSKGKCKCCTQLEKGSKGWLPKQKIWGRQGSYYSKDNPNETSVEYWCGYKKQIVNDLIKESTREGCTAPLTK